MGRKFCRAVASWSCGQGFLLMAWVQEEKSQELEGAVWIWRVPGPAEGVWGGGGPDGGDLVWKVGGSSETPGTSPTIL